jgi:enamine deaminase RidA (YjgF/YER057c/UK114 family)
MSARVLLPSGWLPPVGYANGIEASGRIVFIAGQVGWDAQQHFHSEELVPQFEQALDCSPRRAACRSTSAA